MWANTDADVSKLKVACQKLLSVYHVAIVVVVVTVILVPCANQSERRPTLKSVAICMYTYIVVHINTSICHTIARILNPINSYTSNSKTLPTQAS